MAPSEADQLFFDQVRATAERDEKVVEAAQANSLSNFSVFFDRILEDLFIAWMEGNEEIFCRVMKANNSAARRGSHRLRRFMSGLAKATRSAASNEN